MRLRRRSTVRDEDIFDAMAPGVHQIMQQGMSIEQALELALPAMHKALDDVTPQVARDVVRRAPRILRHQERANRRFKRRLRTQWAVAQLVHDGGLEVPAGVSLLVGENGSGTSSLIQALAAAYPRPVTSPFAHVSGPEPSREDSSLPRHLRARVHPMASPYGFFLRAEMMHGYFAGIDADPTQARA